MAGNTDVPDLAGRLGFFQRFQRAAGTEHGFQFRSFFDVVHLIQVDHVGLQHFQADVDILGHAVFGAGKALGRQYVLAASPSQMAADFFLTVRVAPRRVDKVDAPVQRGMQHRPRFLHRASLDRQRAEADAADLQAGPA